jgi:glucose-1-phosphate adenylyltransferase
VSVDPVFNLYNHDWPIWTYPVQMPGAKFTLRGLALDSIVSPGCIVSGGSIEDSVLSPNVRVYENAKVSDSVILSNVTIGPRAIVRRAILDKNVVVPEDARVGVNEEEDRARGFTISDTGITVVGKGVPVGPS